MSSGHGIGGTHGAHSTHGTGDTPAAGDPAEPLAAGGQPQVPAQEAADVVGHMTPEQFRAYGYATIDWIATYLATLEDRPVRSTVEPGDVRAALPPRPPATGEPFAAVLADLDELIAPALTHWQHPSFFAFFPANSSGPAILGELLSAGLGVQGMLWETSPAVTELEQHVLDWVVELLGLPAAWRSSTTGGGVIQDSASSATLCALLAARHRVTGGASRTQGVDRPLVVYGSTQAHSSVEKAVRIAGHGSDQFRAIPVDARFALRPDALAAQIAEDQAAGLTPCMVVASVGTTSSLAVDPVAEIAPIAAAAGAWLHVDAAMLGVAAVAPELRWINAGLAQADSYATNPHKWLLTNFDCTTFFVADAEPLVDALSILPAYLRSDASASGGASDLRDWQIPLGRRFRALKLWMVLRWYGAEGLAAYVRGHVALAARFAERVEADERLELAAPVEANLVCFAHRAGNEATAALQRALRDRGVLYLTATELDDRLVLRLAVGATSTTARHVDAAWAELSDTLASVKG